MTEQEYIDVTNLAIITQAKNLLLLINESSDIVEQDEWQVIKTILNEWQNKYFDKLST